MTFLDSFTQTNNRLVDDSIGLLIGRTDDGGGFLGLRNGRFIQTTLQEIILGQPIIMTAALAF